MALMVTPCCVWYECVVLTRLISSFLAAQTWMIAVIAIGLATAVSFLTATDCYSDFEKGVAVYMPGKRDREFQNASHLELPDRELSRKARYPPSPARDMRTRGGEGGGGILYLA